jgi:hypothetical protein
MSRLATTSSSLRSGPLDLTLDSQARITMIRTDVVFGRGRGGPSTLRPFEPSAHPGSAHPCLRRCPRSARASQNPDGLDAIAAFLLVLRTLFSGPDSSNEKQARTARPAPTRRLTYCIRIHRSERAWKFQLLHSRLVIAKYCNSLLEHCRTLSPDP